MKLTQTGLPLSFARSIVSPPRSGRTSLGAGSPTWNWPGIGERGGSVGRGVGDATDGTASDGSADVPPDPEGAGDGDRVELGCGVGETRDGVGDEFATAVP